MPPHFLPEVSLDGALQFLDWLKANGFDAWQMLPLTPPDEHGSPYASPPPSLLGPN